MGDKPLPRPVTTTDIYLAEILAELKKQNGSDQKPAGEDVSLKEPGTKPPRKRRTSRKKASS